MRIAIDARMMGAQQTRGIGRYVEELVRALLDVCDDTFCLLVKERKSCPFSASPRLEILEANVPYYGWEEQWRMASFFRKCHVNLVHVPHWNIPLAYRGPLVVTIHDLILRHHPKSAKITTRTPLVARAKRIGYRLVLRDVMRKARTLCVPTQWVADDAHHLYDVPLERIIVTGEGITTFPPPDVSLVPPHPYLFYVGAAYPHKRVDLLLDAWQDLAKRHPDHHLLIAGEQDIFMRQQEERAKYNKAPRVSFLGPVSDAVLAGLYQHAGIFVFPSSDEGFGLPVLEALSYGCPVVSSNATCLPELLRGTPARFFQSGEKNDMIRVIEYLFFDLPAVRQAVKDAIRGIRDHWTWRRAAEKTCAAYKQALGKSGFRT